MEPSGTEPLAPGPPPPVIDGAVRSAVVSTSASTVTMTLSQVYVLAWVAPLP